MGDPDLAEDELANLALAIRHLYHRIRARCHTEAEHARRDRLFAAWRGLLEDHTDQDLRRWRRYVEDAERWLERKEGDHDGDR